MYIHRFQHFVNHFPFSNFFAIKTFSPPVKQDDAELIKKLKSSNGAAAVHEEDSNGAEEQDEDEEDLDEEDLGEEEEGEGEEDFDDEGEEGEGIIIILIFPTHYR